MPALSYRLLAVQQKIRAIATFELPGMATSRTGLLFYSVTIIEIVTEALRFGGLLPLSMTVIVTS